MTIDVNFETRMIELRNRECKYSIESCKRFRQTLIDGITKNVLFVSSENPNIILIVFHKDSNTVCVKTKELKDTSYTEEVMSIAEYRMEIYNLFSKVYQLA